MAEIDADVTDGARPTSGASRWWWALLAAATVAGLLAVTLARDTEPDRAELARSWLESAARGDLEGLRASTFVSGSGDDDSNLEGVIALVDELGGLERVVIGRVLAGGGSPEPISAVCTRLVGPGGATAEGGLRFRSSDGRWQPWEWLQLVGCQGDAGGYAKG